MRIAFLKAVEDLLLPPSVQAAIPPCVITPESEAECLSDVNILIQFILNEEDPSGIPAILSQTPGPVLAHYAQRIKQAEDFLAVFVQKTARATFPELFADWLRQLLLREQPGLPSWMDIPS